MQQSIPKYWPRCEARATGPGGQLLGTAATLTYLTLLGSLHFQIDSLKKFSMLFGIKANKERKQNKEIERKHTSSQEERGSFPAWCLGGFHQGVAMDIAQRSVRGKERN